MEESEEQKVIRKYLVEHNRKVDPGISSSEFAQAHATAMIAWSIMYLASTWKKKIQQNKKAED